MIVPSWAEEDRRPGEVGHHPGPGHGLRDRPASDHPRLPRAAPGASSRCRTASSTSAAAPASWRWRRFGSARGSAVGIDTDPLAVTAARENAERNGLADRFEAREGTLPATADERYPLVLANLVAAVLVELAGPLAAHLAPGGTLLASGIIEPRASEVEDAMRAAGLSVAERRVDGEWVSLRLECAGMTLHRFFVAPDALDGDRFPLPAIDRAAGSRRAAPGRWRSDRPAARRRVAGPLPAGRRRVRGGGAVGGRQRAAAPADGRAGAPEGRRAGGGGAARDRDRRRRLPARRHRALHRARDLAPEARAAADDRPRGGRAVGARDRAARRGAGAAPGRARRRIGPALRAARRRRAGAAGAAGACRHRPRGRLQRRPR